MKQVLSLLTAFVLLQVQTWALSGGPIFPNTPNQAGIYSGVMVQVAEKFGDEFAPPNSGTTSNKDNPAGNIGVFTITVPPSALATGTIVLFVNGTIFTGTITGVADSSKSTFEGIIDANAQNLLQVVNAVGQMKTKIKEQGRTPLPGRTATTDGNAARMEGRATVDASDLVNLNLTPRSLVQAQYTVSGFRQTTTAL